MHSSEWHSSNGHKTKLSNAFFCSYSFIKATQNLELLIQIQYDLIEKISNAERVIKKNHGPVNMALESYL